MSTRANVIITETNVWNNETHTESLVFYRHSDGYPENTMPVLELFLKWVKAGHIRDNISQSAGWLVIIGAIEYNTIPGFIIEHGLGSYGDLESIETPKDWKVGAFEPTVGIHGDIQYLYVVDLARKVIDVYDNRQDFDRIGNKLLGHKIESI